MLKWLKKWFKDWLNDEPRVDVINRAIDGTPLTVFITPRGMFSRGWRIENTSESIKGSMYIMGIQMDFGKHQDKAIDALEGRLDNLFTLEALERISITVEAAIKAKGYRAFKHNGKPHMEFVSYSLDPRDVKKLQQALTEYNFRKLSTKKKS